MISPLYSRICPNPIFIIGSPRSGTSVLAWSLGHHSCLWTSRESELLFDLFGNGRAAHAYASSVPRADGTWMTENKVSRDEFLTYLGLGVNALYTSRSLDRRWIDQTPVNTFMVQELSSMFPGAQFIQLRRDPRRVVNSMINFKLRVDFLQQADNAGQGVLPSWAKDFRDACQTWAMCTDCSQYFQDCFPDRCLTVPYEKLTAEPCASFRRIFDFLNEPRENLSSEFFRTNRINSSFVSDEGVTFRSVPPKPWSLWTDEQKEIFAAEIFPTMKKYRLIKDQEIASYL